MALDTRQRLTWVRKAPGTYEAVTGHYLIERYHLIWKVLYRVSVQDLSVAEIAVVETLREAKNRADRHAQCH